MADSWLLVGLGNPGRKYAGNRHNAGFLVLDRWRDLHEEPGLTEQWREKFHGLTCTVRLGAHKVVCLKPQTFMNASGKSVAAAATFFQVPPAHVVVVHDELDFACGRVAVKCGGGHGGHNGLRDIIACTGSREFIRVRVGIGRPEASGVSVASWVLTDFSAVEQAQLREWLELGAQACTSIIEHGVPAAMNTINAINRTPKSSSGESAR